MDQKIYEYKMEVFGCFNTVAAERRMNELGKDGWRVISVVNPAGAPMIVTFEREKK